MNYYVNNSGVASFFCIIDNSMMSEKDLANAIPGANIKRTGEAKSSSGSRYVRMAISAFNIEDAISYQTKVHKMSEPVVFVSSIINEGMTR